jgi:hypothetical protein
MITILSGLEVEVEISAFGVGHVKVLIDLARLAKL